MDHTDDFLLALKLQEEFDRESTESESSSVYSVKSDAPRIVSSQHNEMSLVDPSWELIDPNPDARALFIEFNHKYFWGKLDGVEVRWSPRMTLCAGVCSYEGRGGLCSVRLSVPLLKLRPRKDLVETLLHEMIHAYLFVTANNRDRDGHGPEFQKHMNRINKATGTNITIYHSFHDEVASCRQHWWRCNGPCQKRPPYYGMVKRSMNRAPAPTDFWWAEHQKTCGGTYTKVREPDGYGEKKKKKEETESQPDKKKGGIDIRKFINNGTISKDNNKPSTSGVNSSNKPSATVTSKDKSLNDKNKQKNIFTKTKSGGSSTLTNLIDAPALSRKDLLDSKNSSSKVPPLPTHASLSRSARVSTINDYESDGAAPAPFNPELKKVKSVDIHSQSDNSDSADLPDMFSGRGVKLGGHIAMNDHRQRRIPGLFEPSLPQMEDTSRNDFRFTGSEKPKQSDQSLKERKRQALLKIFDSDSDDDFEHLIPRSQPVKQNNNKDKSGFLHRKSLEDGRQSVGVKKENNSSDESDIDDNVSLISGKKIDINNRNGSTNLKIYGDYHTKPGSSSERGKNNGRNNATALSQTNVLPKPSLKNNEESGKKRTASDSIHSDHNNANKRPRLEEEQNRTPVNNSQPNHDQDMLQTCPVCQQQYPASYMNTHLDQCLQG